MFTLFSLRINYGTPCTRRHGTESTIFAPGTTDPVRQAINKRPDVALTVHHACVMQTSSINRDGRKNGRPLLPLNATGGIQEAATWAVNSDPTTRTLADSLQFIQQRDRATPQSVEKCQLLHNRTGNRI